MGSPNTLDASLSAELDDLGAQGLFRSRVHLDGAQGPRVRIEGREYLSFASNDYLGLASDARVIEALRSGALGYGAGAGASASAFVPSVPSRLSRLNSR